MQNQKLSVYFDFLSAHLAEKGRLTLPEALAACDVQSFNDLRLFNRVIRQMAKAGLRKGDVLTAPPEAK